MKPTTSLRLSDPVREITQDLDLAASRLSYPHHSVFGTANFPKLAAFFALFGYQPRRLPLLAAEAAKALYGLDGPAEQWLLRSAGLDSPIRVIATPHAAEPAVPMQLGPYGLDIYTSDLALTLELAKAVSVPTTDIVAYKVEDWPRDEARAIGPEEFTIFLIESEIQRFPSALDREYWRAHSQVHMLCWVVDRIEDERRFWCDEAGMTIMRDVMLDPDAMVDLMSHPRRVRMGAVQVADEEIHRRMELMHYPDDNVPRRADWPLRGGFHSGAFRVQNLEAMVERMRSAEFGSPTEADFGAGPYRVIGGRSPGGIRFELWQPVS